jgi:hypothetical protein
MFDHSLQVGGGGQEDLGMFLCCCGQIVEVEAKKKCEVQLCAEKSLCLKVQNIIKFSL